MQLYEEQGSKYQKLKVTYEQMRQAFNSQKEERQVMKKEIERLKAKTTEEKLEELRINLSTRISEYEMKEQEIKSLSEIFAQATSPHPEINILKEKILRLEALLSSVDVRKIGEYEANIQQLKKSINEYMKGEAVLTNELDGIGKAYEELQARYSKLGDQLSEKDHTCSMLISENLKLKQKDVLLEKEKDSLNTKVDIQSKQLLNLQEEKKKIELAIRKLQLELTHIEKENIAKDSVIEVNRRKTSELTHQVEELAAKIEKQQDQLSDLRKAVKEKTELIEKNAHEYKRTLEDNASLKKRNTILEKQKGKENSAGGGDDKEREELLKMYKKLLTCSVCQKEHKDTVLLKCMHVFCKSCIDRRIQDRERRCPNCAVGFSNGDIKTIYL